MKKYVRKSVLWCLIFSLVLATVAVMNTSAASESELRNEISNLEKESAKLEKQIGTLKAQNAEKQKIVDAYQAKIDKTTAQKRLCENEIAKIDAAIRANEAEIKEKQDAIDENMQGFKKRLRASYMNGTYNSTLVLLGTSDFSNYLELQELTNSVASHDRQLIEQIVEDAKVVEAEKAENEALRDSQVEIRNELVAKEKEIRDDQAEVQKLINEAAAEANDLSAENAEIEAKIKKDKKALEEKIRQASPIIVREMNAGGFIWPVPGHHGITQHFGNGHTGMDIADGGIGGQPIVAIADGVVRSDYYKSGWTSADGKWGLNSYGNYVVVDHGTYQGDNYSSWYAHMARVAVSPGQTVKQGQVLGYVGNTGNVFGRTGIHLHLSIKKNGYWVNPYSYVG